MAKCLHCRHARYIHQRGLCRRCYNDIGVRFKYPDTRTLPREGKNPPCRNPVCHRRAAAKRRGLCVACSVDPKIRAAHAEPDVRSRPVSDRFSERNRILEDPVLCPTSFLIHWAKQTLRRFGNCPRIDINDLVQAAWPSLVRAADSWRPGGSTATLMNFAGRIVRCEMVREARRHITSVTFGDSEGMESGRKFCPSRALSSAESWREFLHSVRMTDHAVIRYRERFHPGASVAEIRRTFRRAKVAPEWFKRFYEWRGGTGMRAKSHRTLDSYYLLTGDIVFVVDVDRKYDDEGFILKDFGVYVVTTVLSLSQAAAEAAQWDFEIPDEESEKSPVDAPHPNR